MIEKKTKPELLVEVFVDIANTYSPEDIDAAVVLLQDTLEKEIESNRKRMVEALK